MPDDLQLVPTNDLPLRASWYSVRRWGHYPPSPANWCAGRGDVLYYRSATFGTNRIIIDDRTVDYPLQPTTPGTSYGSGDDTGPFPSYSSNDFYLEISLDPNRPGFVDITAHGLISNYFCQLLTNTDLSTKPIWVPGPYFHNSPPTDQFTFDPIPARSPAQDFFRGVQLQANYIAYVTGGGEANEPSPTDWFPGQDAYFEINLPTEVTNGPLTIYYTLSGTATNGLDYTNLTGFVTIPNSNYYALVYIHPTNDNILDFDETVVLTLVPTNGYVVNPTASQATIIIHDNPFIPVAMLDMPTSIDYSPTTNALLISANLDYNTINLIPTNNFFRLTTNGSLTLWSGVSNVYGEVKIATVKVTTNGFTAGDMFFSSDQPGQIGWVSADGTQWTNNWVTLAGETNHFWGALYFDRTGIWDNDLIAVTGEGLVTDGSRSIWRIHSPTSYSRIAVVTNETQLEAVITLPADARYGPWAGKVITAGEYTRTIYATDTNGVTTPLNTYDIFPEGIEASDFDIVPPNQDLYCTLQEPDSKDQGLVMIIPKTFLTNFVGYLLITESGENIPPPPPDYLDHGKLFLLHWDPATTNFVANRVFAPQASLRCLEHSTFAPITVQPLVP
jgi:hypothetical protein